MQVKELMIPVDQYVSVPATATLLDAFLALEEGGSADGAARAPHRDVLVLDDGGGLAGVLTMRDVFRALEPNYRNLDRAETDHSLLTRDYVAKMFSRYDLWTDALPTLCSRVAALSVADVMHEPPESEFVDADDDLEAAIHRCIVGVRQPLLVRSGGALAGVLRFSDVYETVRTHILACQR